MPYLDLGDTRLSFDIEGSGPPILFCSATATHGDVWKLRQTSDLSRDFTVITFDQRGTGKSKTSSRDFSTKRLAEDAAALLLHVGVGPAVVCGHSNGGRVAQQLAVDHYNTVAKLILMSSGGSSGSPGIPLAVCKGMVEQGYEPWLRQQATLLGFTRRYVAENSDLVNEFLSVRLANPPSLEVYLRHVIGRQDFDLADHLCDIKTPTLVLVGEDEGHDAQGTHTHLDHARLLADAIPNAVYHLVRDQGHYYYFSAFEETNELIRTFAQTDQVIQP